MLLVHSKQELADQVSEWRHNDEHIALVPTMGSLHAGHLALVELAREQAERVVVSIFVNPAQFGEDEDYDTYPRTLERDRIRLKTTAADMIFAPDVDTVYPFGIENATTILVPGLTENYCGASRPGHFEGVTAVVARLFAMVQPDVAVFGQKDYQQQLVIRRMVEDLSFPVSIITSATIRDDDGLAMSSRNAYLSEEQRAIAPLLYERLSLVGRELQNGQRNFNELETLARESLLAEGFEVEYFAIRRALNLEIPDRDCDDLVVLAAATLGRARLIDNVVVTV
ncbi:MAG: pantoate--beta-alanine ligase [Woeseiaceae bacterium]